MSEHRTPGEIRKKEIEKSRIESERRIAVAHFKLAGKIIEDIDKSRKRDKVLSLLQRILHHFDMIKSSSNILRQTIEKYQDVPMTNEEVRPIGYMIDDYKSIREDFIDVTDITEEKLKKIFPERDTYFNSREQAIGVLYGIFDQETQMSKYLLRYIT